MYKKHLTELEARMADEQEQAEFLKSTIESYASYVRAITKMEMSMQINRIRMDTKIYQEITMELDRTRKINHDNCISNLKITNRMAKAYGMDEIFPDVENSNRAYLADNYIIPVAKEYAVCETGSKPSESKGEPDSMFKEKIEQLLLEKCKNDMKVLDIIECTIDTINDYVYALSTGKNPKNITCKDCVSNIGHINALCEKVNIGKVFPQLGEMSEAEVTKEYIISLVYDYVEKRIR